MPGACLPDCLHSHLQPRGITSFLHAQQLVVACVHVRCSGAGADTVLLGFKIQGVGHLLALPALHFLDIRGTAALQHGVLHKLARRFSLQVFRP